MTPVNDAPTASNVAVSANEDAVASGSVVASDVDGDTPTYSAGATTPTNGSVVVNADGGFDYTPDADFYGTDSFTIAFDDGNGGTGEATVSVTVAPVNDAPTASAVVVSGAEDTVISGSVVASDVDGDTPTYSAGATTPTNGSVVVNADGSFDYTPDANFNGTDSFTVAFDDGNGGTNEATVSVTVAPVNDAPTASAVAVSGAEDTVISGSVVASDIDGDTPTYSAGATTPTNGSVIVNADGSFDYTPDADFYGTDSFTVAFDDGNGGTNEATVSVTVAPVNDAPTASAVAVSGAEDTVISGSVVASDVDGDTPTYSAGATGPSNGSVVVNADGSFDYTPDADFFGSDAFTVAFDDGNGGTGEATVNVTVDQVVGAPVAMASKAVTFDGVDDHISAGDPGAASDDLDIGTRDFTVEAWFYYDGTNNQQSIVTKGASYGTEESYRIIVYNGELTIGVSTGGFGLDDQTAASRTSLPGAGWYHVAMVVDQQPGGEVSTVTGYLNGSSAGWTAGATLVGDATFVQGDIDTDEDFLIGADGAGGGQDDHFNGEIADVRLWDKARSAAEIQADMARTLDGSEANLIGHWAFGEGSGATAGNSVAGAPDGALANGAAFADTSSVSTYVDKAVEGRIEASDGDALSFSVHTNATNGVATIDAATGAWEYTPHASFVGTETIIFQVSDGNGGTDTVDVTVTVGTDPNNNAPTVSAGVGVDFAAGDFDAGVADNAIEPGTGDFTAEAWFYYDGTAASTGMILSDGNEDANKEGYSIFVDNGNLVVRVGDGGNTDQKTAASHIDLGATPGWKHVAMVIDQSTGEVRGYLDGDGTGWTAGYGAVTNAAFDPGDIKPNEDFMIGATEKASDVAQYGTMPVSDVRLWSGARSQADIADDMSRTLTGGETDLVGNWRLDEGSGSTAADSSANGNGATGINTSAWVSTASVTTEVNQLAFGRLTASDADGDALTFTVQSNGGNGVASIDAATGAWKYTPNAGFTGTDTVTFIVSDGNGGLSTIDVAVTVAPDPSNNAPVLAAAGGLDFSGGDGAVETSGSNDLDMRGTDFTVEAWFYYDGSASFDEMIVAKGNSDDDAAGYSIRVDGDELVVRLNAAGGDANGDTAAQSINLGSDAGWKHVAMVIDNANGTIKGYLDGSNAGWTNGHDTVANATYSGGDVDTTETLLIGASKVGATYDKWGNLGVSDVRIWDTARSEADIQADMNRTLDGTETNLVANWKLDEGTGTDAADTGPSGRDGLLNGVTPSWLPTSTVSTGQNATAHGRLTATDADGDALVYSLAADGANGTATIDAETGAWEYTPDTDYTGSDTVSYQVSDGNGGLDTLSITINVS